MNPLFLIIYTKRRKSTSTTIYDVRNELGKENLDDEVLIKDKDRAMYQVGHQS